LREQHKVSRPNKLNSIREAIEALRLAKQLVESSTTKPKDIWERIDHAVEMIEGFWRIAYNEERDHPDLKMVAQEVSKALDALKGAVGERESAEAIRKKMAAFESKLEDFSKKAGAVLPDTSSGIWLYSTTPEMKEYKRWVEGFRGRLRWAVVENIMATWLPVLSEGLAELEGRKKEVLAKQRFPEILPPVSLEWFNYIDWDKAEEKKENFIWEDIKSALGNIGVEVRKPETEEEEDEIIPETVFPRSGAAWYLRQGAGAVGFGKEMEELADCLRHLMGEVRDRSSVHETVKALKECVNVVNGVRKRILTQAPDSVQAAFVEVNNALQSLMERVKAWLLKNAPREDKEPGEGDQSV
jgi:predicted RNA binding protein with dsRBD fold (UPF0201 family)